MKCPFCLNDATKVVDKRDTKMSTRRRRECLKCEKRFTTFERCEDMEMIIVKRNGERERYDRTKLQRGLVKACEKRHIPGDAIEHTVEKIETELRKLDSTEICSSKIGAIVMKYLKRLDKVAYIRFASVYKDFADVDEFEKELKKLLKR